MKDRALADFHARRAMTMATETGSPYILVNALACRGVAHLVAGRFALAVDNLAKALSVARSRKAGLEGEARILADLANAHRLNGEPEAAQLVAAEAIEVAVAAPGPGACSEVPRSSRAGRCLGEPAGWNWRVPTWRALECSWRRPAQGYMWPCWRRSASGSRKRLPRKAPANRERCGRNNDSCASCGEVPLFATLSLT
ncbi:MAG: tetratricopeptide repeat protein [Bradyrhizobium sp.]